ncbi:MAG: 4-(cytidine 5'-diphospho)-2-C-methyl-D-erythritol kinase [Geminicoccaceae bacterium]
MLGIEETAYAKVNLDLRVSRRRADGYHDLDSLVAFADIGDRLTFDRADGLEFAIKGPFGGSLPNDERNLVAAAARSLGVLLNREIRVSITLDKRLPVAAGLGGGSADAAAALRGLIRLCDLPLTPADLMPVARSLGADVPVCLSSTAVRMQGVGDRLSPMPLPAELPVVLVNPGDAVATPDVFRALQEFSGSRPTERLGATDHSFRRQLEKGVNDLETPAIAIAPAIRKVLDALRRQPGCSLARMSGSGATCFGLFEDARARDHAVSTLVAARPDWWIAGTVLR